MDVGLAGCADHGQAGPDQDHGGKPNPGRYFLNDNSVRNLANNVSVL